MHQNMEIDYGGLLKVLHQLLSGVYVHTIQIIYIYISNSEFLLAHLSLKSFNNIKATRGHALQILSPPSTTRVGSKSINKIPS